MPTNRDLSIGRYVGCPPGSNNFAFPGDIDEVEIFNRALTDSEIAAIFNAGNLGKCKFVQVTIDIKPDSFPNCINIFSKGVIPVAILGSATFNVQDINVNTLQLNGLSVKMTSGILCHVENINNDAFPDLVCQFANNNTAWPTETTVGTVTGMLNNGTPIQGEDTVCLVKSS